MKVLIFFHRKIWDKFSVRGYR